MGRGTGERGDGGAIPFHLLGPSIDDLHFHLENEMVLFNRRVETLLCVGTHLSRTLLAFQALRYHVSTMC